MIRNGYARRLQVEAERSCLTEQWQVYPESVRRSLHMLLRECGLMVAQRATEMLAVYATSSLTAEEGQGADFSHDWKRMRHQGSDLKGTYSFFSLQADSQSLLPLGQYLVVDTDFEMVHLMRHSSPPFVLSQRWNDVELAIILPLLGAWPTPVSYETLYESLCKASWEGTFREFRRYLPALLNACTQQLFRLGMEIAGNGSRVQLTSCA